MHAVDLYHCNTGNHEVVEAGV